MQEKGKALFIYKPRRIEDLRYPHRPEEETAYEVVKTISLSSIEYENFITDLLADRQFIEENAALCGEGATFRCLLIRQHGCNEGILIVPELKAYVKLAAYIDDETGADV